MRCIFTFYTRVASYCYTLGLVVVLKISDPHESKSSELKFGWKTVKE